MKLNIFKKIKTNRHIFLSLFLFALFLFSLSLNSRFPTRSAFLPGEFKEREIGFIEFFFFTTAEESIFGISEIIILAAILGIIFLNRKYLINTYNRFSYYLKFLIFSILMYEELSFLTAYKFDFANSINDQGELNIHNSKILTAYIFDYVPILGKVGYITTLITLALFFIGYGSFFKRFKNLSFIFLERKNSFYINIYWLNLFFSNLLVSLNLRDYYGISKMNININFVLGLELVELFIYVIFLIDTNDKVRIAKKNYLQKNISQQ